MPISDKLPSMNTENTSTLAPVELVIPADSGLEIESVKSLEELFKPLFAQAEEWRVKALACKVTDINDKRGMKFARESRLALRAIRIEVEKRRKTAKEDSLRKGKAIDGMANIFKAAVEPIEEFLLEQEEFAERHEAARVAALHEERAKVIAPFLGEGQPMVLLGAMPQEEWDRRLSDAKLLHQAKIDEARRVEEERLAREKAEAEERERVRLENERLKKEAVEREAAAKAERERMEAERREIEAKAKAEHEAAEQAALEAKRKAEAEAAAAAEKARKEKEAIEATARAERAEAERKAEQERIAREKAEAEARQLREAEERRQQEERARQEKEAAERAEAERKAANAPDKEKLLSFAAEVRALKVPSVSTKEAQATAADIAQKVENFAHWIESQTLGL